MKPKKKTRKRAGKNQNKKGASASQSAPRVMDKLPTQWRPFHILGKPMLPPEVLPLLTPDMRSLHDSVLFIEKELLKSRSPTYPLFPVRVPLAVGFVDKYPAELFFLKFKDLFNV